MSNSNQDHEQPRYTNENNNKKAKILIKTPIAMQNNQKSSNSLILDQGTKKIENTDGGQSKRASVKLTNSKNYNIKSSSEAFIGLQNTNNSHGMIHVVSDIRPTSSEYPVKSHLPVVHNYVIQFDQNTLKAKELKGNKYNALKDTKDEVVHSPVKKSKLIVWDNGSKQWISSDPLNPDLQLVNLNQKTQEILSIDENYQPPLQKIESITSEDGYRIYDSYYKRELEDQESSFDTRPQPKYKNEEKGGSNPVQTATLSEQFISNTLIPQDVEMYTEFESQMNPEELTNAYLFSLVNRSNVLPTQDNKNCIGRTMIPNPRLKKKQIPKQKFQVVAPELPQKLNEDIRIDSQGVMLNAKFSLPELEKQEYAFIEPQSIGIDGQLMLQASGLNHHNGYEEFVRQLEKQSKQKQKEAERPEIGTGDINDKA